jgi:pectinesterase
MLKDDVQCVNLSQGGRSSRSFIAEGHWKKVLAQKPDYVLIQFGHNDQPGKGPERETDPQTTYKQFLGQMVDEARSIGAMPILVTSLSRRSWQPDGTSKSNLTAYAEAVKELAAAKHVPLIDLHARSIALYNKLGKEKVDELSARTADGKVDNTHLGPKGSEVVGAIVAEQLKAVVPALAAHIK